MTLPGLKLPNGHVASSDGVASPRGIIRQPLVGTRPGHYASASRVALTPPCGACGLPLRVDDEYCPRCGS